VSGCPYVFDDRYRRGDHRTPTWFRPALVLWGRTNVNVTVLDGEPSGFSYDLRRERKSREVGASVCTCHLPVLTRSGAAACHSEPALPVETIRPRVHVTHLRCIERSAVQVFQIV
jgi:hypothetical protein